MRKMMHCRKLFFFCIYVLYSPYIHTHTHLVLYSLKFNVIYHILYPLLLHIYLYNIIFLCKQYKIGIFSFIITMLYIMNFKHTDIWPTLSPSNKFRFQMYVCEICAHYTSLKYYTSIFLKLFSVLSSIFKRSVVFNLIVRLDLRVLMDLKNPL